MAIEVECPKCGAFLRLEEHLAGKQVECTECGGMMTVPKPEVPPAKDMPEAEGGVTFEQRMAVEADKVRRKEAIPFLAKHTGKVILVVALLLAMLLVVNLPWIILRIKVQDSISSLETGNTPQRRAAAKQLAKSPNATAVRALIKFAKDPDVTVRRRCIEALGKVGDRRASDVLVELLEDPGGAVRADAAWSLATCGKQDAIPALRDILARRELSGQLEGGARYALYMLGDKQQFDALISMLTSADNGGRARAADALGEIGDADTIYYLEKAAASNPAIVKAAIVEAIEKIKERQY